VQDPHRDALREGLKHYRRKSTVLALALFATDAAAYLVCFRRLASLDWPFILKLPSSILLGVLITRLAIVGHDAAHGSLTDSGPLNAIIGRLALLPGLHAFSLWKVGHNRIHHAFTNLKGLDFIWAPFSPGEYRALPPRRRMLERLYRSPAGFGIYYLIEIWWKYLSPKGLGALRQRRAIHSLDLLLVFGFLVGEVIAARGAVLVAVFIPFLVWNWLMGFIIFNHHTHPSTRFFKNRTEWRFFEAQIQGTVHVVFPRAAGYLLSHIMEHTAHHFDVNIPCYRLRAAQRFIERQLAGALIVERWSCRRFLETCRRCQLYDYDRHRWATFDEALRQSESRER
jgi:omega-6 fatty acid desaturase (delta-12 desaturase)